MMLALLQICFKYEYYGFSLQIPRKGSMQTLTLGDKEGGGGGVPKNSSRFERMVRTLDLKVARSFATTTCVCQSP